MNTPTAIDMHEVGVDAVVAAPFVLIAALIGYLLGRRSEVQGRVDAVLRRETRDYHPAGRQRAGAVPSPLPAPPPLLAPVPPRAYAGTKCLRLVQTSLGQVPCLRETGHDGGCQ